MAELWRCPICNGSFAIAETSAVCDQNHSFDFARQGYLNLLPVNFKHSKSPGDDKAMLSARRQFLQKGYYQALLEHLITLQAQIIDGQASPLRAMDLGGGEGFFSAKLQQASNSTMQWYLSDISKEAVRLASSLFVKGRCSVASSYNLPIPDASLDIVLRNFAPSSDQELQRIIKPGGTCIIVSPGEDHLIELRQLLYSAPKKHAPPKDPDGFVLQEKIEVFDTVEISDADDRDHVFAMTPMVWRADRQVREQWLNLSDTRVRLSFLISVYRFAP